MPVPLAAEPAASHGRHQERGVVLPMRKTYTNVSNAVLDMDLDPYELAVYMAVARQDYDGHGGREPIGQPELMERAHIKERRGRMALLSLRAKGLVNVEPSGGHRFIYTQGNGTPMTPEKSAPRAEKTRRKSAPRAGITTDKSRHVVQENSARGASKTARGADPSLLTTHYIELRTSANAEGTAPPPEQAPIAAQNEQSPDPAPNLSKTVAVEQPAAAPPKNDGPPYRVFEALCAASATTPALTTRQRKGQALTEASAALTAITAAYEAEGEAADPEADLCGCLRWVATKPQFASGKTTLRVQFAWDDLGKWRAMGRPVTFSTPQSQNGHYNGRAAPAVSDAVQTERDQRQHERREKHFKRYGTYDGFD